MSKHGGSESSGLVAPVGMGDLVRLDGSTMFEPPEVTAAKKQAIERKERARQFERRRLALAVLPEVLGAQVQSSSQIDVPEMVCRALAVADELMAQTGNEVA